MRKVLSLLVLLVLVLGMSGNALYADVDWDNESGDRLWSNPLNWEPNSVPTSADKAAIRNATGDGPIIDSSTTAVTNNLVVGDWGNTNTLDITGGSLTTNNWFIVGYGADDDGTFNVSGGSTTVSGGSTDLTIGRAGIGRLNMSDGSITVGDRLYFGREAAGIGYLDMTGGLITVNDDLYIEDGTAHMAISGGEINISSRIYLGNDPAAKADLTMTGGLITLGGLMVVGRNDSLGELFLYGGILEIGEHLEMGANGTIDITDGTMIIEGDRISEGVDRSIIPFLDNGQITAYGGIGGMLMVDYDTTNPGKTTVTAIVVPTYISPENGGTFASPADVDLIWTNIDPNAPGDPVFVDVWFGTDPNKLQPLTYSKKVTAGEDTEIWTETALAAGTYYWQVDSYIYGADHKNEPNMIAGPVWSFNVVDDTAPSVVIDTPYMVTWSGQGVPLNATLSDDGQSTVTYLWTADPDIGVVFSATNVEDPTVTITKVPYSEARIVNAGFEDPVLAEDDWTWGDTPGWTQVGPDSTGVWNVTLVDFDPVMAPEGENVAYTEYAPDGTVNGLSQILTERFAANTDYTLTVEVGNSYEYYWSGYSTQLLAGGTVIKEDDNILWPDYYLWATSTVEYTYDPAHADLVGQPLEIRLLNLGIDMDAAAPDVVGVEFDDVRLTADPPFPVLSGVETVTLTLAVSDEGNPIPVTDSMMIDVYETACKASRFGLALAEDNQGDFDADCYTGPDDLSMLVAKWLNDTGLTEPVVLTDETYGMDVYLKVDFNSNQNGGGDSSGVDDPGLSVANHNQAGWSSYHANHEVAAEFTTANYGGITVTPGWPNTTDNNVRQLLGRDSGDNASWDNAAGDLNLVRDFIGIDSRTGNGGNGDWDGATGTPTYITLAINGLAAGDYDWISFHHDTENVHGPFAVWLSTDGGSTYTQLADGLMTDGSAGGNPDSGATEDGPDAYTLPSTYNTSFIANGTDDVVMRFAPYGTTGTHRRLWGINGFVIYDPNAPDVDAGDNMVALSGQDVTLAPTIVEKDPTDWTNLTYHWTAEPDTGVSFSATDVEAPTVTITKATDNPSIVTLTLAVYGEGKPMPVEDTLTIDVYNDTCLASLAAGIPLDEMDLDGNCVINLEESAKMAETWLVDYEIEDPAPKPVVE